MINDFLARVCIGYNSFLHAQASSYRDYLNASLKNVKWRDEYRGDFHVCVGKHGHSFHLQDEDSNKHRRGSSPPPESGERGDVFCSRDPFGWALVVDAALCFFQ